MMRNGFPPSITVRMVQKKWTFINEQHTLAFTQKNKRWIYFDLFHNYLTPSDCSERYSYWSNDWIMKLIECRSKCASLFPNSKSRNNEGWNSVERELKLLGLPIDYSLKNIEEIWLNLIDTFKIRHRFSETDLTHDKLWPFYEPIKSYYTAIAPKELDSIKMNPFSRKKIKDLETDFGLESEEENNSECIDDPDDIFVPSHIDDGEFHWTPIWTESFIHMRLQNDEIFQKKKQPWKILYEIMLQNKFPKSITVHQIRKKWTTIYEDYKKAVAKKNTSWIYYNIVNSYLGNFNSDVAPKNWTVKWLSKLINIRIELDDVFKAKKSDEDNDWILVESRLRSHGLPLDCSVRNIHLIWAALIKAFKINHRYIRETSPADVWELYHDMKQYFELCEPISLNRKKACQTELHGNESDFVNNDTDIMEDEDLDVKPDLDYVKEKINLRLCRVCLSNDEPLKSLFESPDNFCEMFKNFTSIELSASDSLPQHICQTCLKELSRAFKFREKCRATDKLLKSSVKQEPTEMLLKTCSSDHFEASNNISDSGSDNELISEIIKREIKREPKETQISLKSMNCRKSVKHKKKLDLHSKQMVSSSSNKIKVKRNPNKYTKICDICGKETRGMRDHMNSHMNLKPHKCPKCPKAFTHRANLGTHIKTHEETPLKICQLCGKQFFRNLTYKRHLVYHANERKFACEVCGKTFNTKDILQVHERSHTGIRPYSCKICGKAFYSSGCVSRHQKVHRKLTANNAAVP